jgi:hypothetical protein
MDFNDEAKTLSLIFLYIELLREVYAEFRNNNDGAKL